MNGKMEGWRIFTKTNLLIGNTEIESPRLRDRFSTSRLICSSFFLYYMLSKKPNLEHHGLYKGIYRLLSRLALPSSLLSHVCPVKALTRVIFSSLLTKRFIVDTLDTPLKFKVRFTDARACFTNFKLLQWSFKLRPHIINRKF